MATHPNRSRTYRGCLIQKSETQFHAESGKALYSVSGRLTKPAGQRPFFTARQHARDWIESLDMDSEISKGNR